MQILLERTVRHVHHHVGDHDDDDDGNPTVAKATAMVVLFLASFTIGNLPIKLNQWFKWNSDAKNNAYVKFLLGVGGGVLLCTTFLHLLPEVNENFEDLNPTPEIEIHYAELLMCTGFFIMYLVEECVHVFLHRKEKVKNIAVLRRSLSIRRGELMPELEVSRLEKHHTDHYHNNHSHVDHSHVDHSHTDHSRTDHSHGDHSHTDHSHTGHSHTDHSHVPIDHAATSTVAIIRGLLVVLALSVHELFEGLAVGLESSPHTVWYMFGAVSAHKLVIAFCIGVELVTSGIKTVLVMIYVFTFAVVSPLGIGIGIFVSSFEGTSTTLVSVILQGLASGTLLYVVFFEILQADKKSGIVQYCAVLAGFIIMFAITLLG